MTPRTIADVADRDTISVEVAARILGISRKLAYEAAQRGEIPVLRIGRRLLVPTHQLRAFLEGHDLETAAAELGIDVSPEGAH